MIAGEWFVAGFSTESARGTARERGGEREVSFDIEAWRPVADGEGAPDLIEGHRRLLLPQFGEPVEVILSQRDPAVAIDAHAEPDRDQRRHNEHEHEHRHPRPHVPGVTAIPSAIRNSPV